MRPLIVTQNITVDGSIEMLDDWFDPAAQDADQLEIQQRDSDPCDAILLGRQTFEDFRGYWPLQEDDRTGITQELNTIEKIVVSSTLTDPAWDRTRIIAGDPVDPVRELKAGEGGEISLTGSITLCHAMFDAGLVDEIRLWVFPHVQGRGRHLVGDGWHGRLELLEHRAFASGVTYARYAPRAA